MILCHSKIPKNTKNGAAHRPPPTMQFGYVLVFGKMSPTFRDSALLYAQSKKSFSVSKNFLRFGLVLPSMDFSSFSSSSRCSLVSLVGVSTTTTKR